MKIKDLQNVRCVYCPIFGYCTEPDKTPQLCEVEEIQEMDVDEYLKIADMITDTETKNQQKKACYWSDKRAGVILNVILNYKKNMIQTT